MNFKDFIDEWNNDRDFIYAKTSGSTGVPKEIRLAKSFVAESAFRTINFFKLDNLSYLHSCISPDYIGGKMMAVRAILCGAYFSWEIPSNQPLKTFSKSSSLDLVAVVPSQMHFILENIEKLPPVKIFIIGGAPIPLELRKRIVNSGIDAYETYGMTETASHIALRKVASQQGPFMLLPGIKIHSNSFNCLCISFPNGYHVETNDIVELISEKEFFVIGRKDDIIISGGKKINPVEIESKIAHILDSSFCITAFPDMKWGEKVVLLIEQNKIIPDLCSKLRNFLESWEMPKEIFYVNNIPTTPNGKIRRIKNPSLLSFVDPDNNLSS